MACTIVSTPSVGATDWTDWITQQGLTDRGFARVSLTNFSGTAASAVGTGGVFECAGSIYNNTTETAISLATATASASVLVYVYAIPAAGGTTCTFELDSGAPVYVDSKQGWYASAASVTRVLGGMFIGTAATYYAKWLYYQTDIGLKGIYQSGESRIGINKARPLQNLDVEGTMAVSGAATMGTTLDVTGVLSADGGLEAGNATQVLKFKILPATWASSDTVTISHGLTQANIRAVHGVAPTAEIFTGVSVGDTQMNLYTETPAIGTGYCVIWYVP